MGVIAAACQSVERKFYRARAPFGGRRPMPEKEYQFWMMWARLLIRRLAHLIQLSAYWMTQLDTDGAWKREGRPTHD